MAEQTSKKRSRAVSSLTEEQIQHKRNIDRRAQRAFRQRTKDCISHLEQQFKQLQETCGHRERDLKSMREQNEMLVQCLETIVDLTTSTLSRISRETGDNEQSHMGDRPPTREPATEAGAISYGESGSSSDTDASDGGIDSGTGASHDAALDPRIVPTQQGSMMIIDHESQSAPDQQSQSSSTHPTATTETLLTETIHVQTTDAPTSRTRNGVSKPNSVGPEVCPSHAARSPLHVADGGLMSPATSYQAANSGLGPEPIGAYTAECHVELESVDGRDVLGAETSSNVGSFAAIPTPASTLATADVVQGSLNPKAAYHVLPDHLPSTCPLDSILLDFLHARRDLIARGMTVETAVGPYKPTAKAIMDASLVSSVPPLSVVMSGVLSTFQHVQKTEKLAFFWAMCLTMRWQISSTSENYYAMPPWLRPTVTQVAVSHPCWIDNIPWPGVRDLLIEKADEYPFHIFSDYYSQNVSVNWPFDSADAVSDFDGGGGALHSIFEKHIRSLKNWTVTPEFCAKFPDMEAAIYRQDY
ncbi:hypothetical protein HJFPF1_04238 [Paramyrothecium foliicola]|nr:hypothetical protein HJFPF1_04238 [Paramyrothecium foliicola]